MTFPSYTRGIKAVVALTVEYSAPSESEFDAS